MVDAYCYVVIHGRRPPVHYYFRFNCFTSCFLDSHITCDTMLLIQRPCYQQEVCAKLQQAIGLHEDLLTKVKRRKLQWYGHVSCSSGLAKIILQGTVKGGRRQGRQMKRWEDNIREWTGLEFAKSQRAVENREKMKETGCEIICG